MSIKLLGLLVDYICFAMLFLKVIQRQLLLCMRTFVVRFLWRTCWLCTRKNKLLEQFSEQKYPPRFNIVNKISPEAACNYGCIVSNPETHEVLHYVEKPSSYISSTINCGVYLFDTSLFGFIRDVMNKVPMTIGKVNNRENKIKRNQGVDTLIHSGMN